MKVLYMRAMHPQKPRWVPYEDAIQHTANGERWYSTHSGDRIAHVYVKEDEDGQYLTTYPDDTTKNNLTEVKVCD
ncbi:MAG: DUF3892 domain-containing protein ['Candidatus Kapabacteria' thiocyanatum]|nr:DUF3892 domain-containing protein ['Candidatus Kapabacteria' thiocyanatum]